MSAENKPVIVFVHGAWHTPEHYRLLFDRLIAAGFDVEAPRLVTSSNDSPVSANLPDDTVIVRRSIIKAADQGHKVILLSHSAGGLSASCAAEGLSLAARNAAQLPGGIVHLIYMTAVMVAKGQSSFDTIVAVPGRVKAPVLVDPAKAGNWPPPPTHLLFSGVEPALAAKATSMMLKNVNPYSLAEPVTYTAWRDIPATYISCGQDGAIIPARQQWMIESAKSAGGKIEVVDLPDSGHSPFLSMPERLVEIVEDVALKYV